MRATKMLVPTFAHNLAVPHNHAADHRVRLDGALAARGEREGVRHVADVVVVAACHDRFLPLVQDGVQRADLPPVGRSLPGVQIWPAAGSGALAAAAAGAGPWEC